MANLFNQITTMWYVGYISIKLVKKEKKKKPTKFGFKATAQAQQLTKVSDSMKQLLSTQAMDLTYIEAKSKVPLSTYMFCKFSDPVVHI